MPQHRHSILNAIRAALLVGGVERLIGVGWLPGLIDPLWDSSLLLDDATPGGRLLAGLIGYRAQPSLMLLLSYAAHWIGVSILRTRTLRHV